MSGWLYCQQTLPIKGIFYFNAKTGHILASPSHTLSCCMTGLASFRACLNTACWALKMHTRKVSVLLSCSTHNDTHFTCQSRIRIWFPLLELSPACESVLLYFVRWVNNIYRLPKSHPLCVCLFSTIKKLYMVALIISGSLCETTNRANPSRGAETGENTLSFKS